MDNLVKLALIGVFAAGLIGCGASDSASISTAGKNASNLQAANIGGETGTPESSISKSSAPQTAASTQPAEPPASVVEKFLQSVRSGDERQTSDLLTDVARRELAKNGWEIQPPGAPSSSYKVGRTEILPEGAGAYVNSTWTETLPNGEMFTYEVVWVLRHQENGWKVAGMATEAVPGEDPVFFSFEHPQDMQRKREAADAALVARQQPSGEARQDPQTPPASSDVHPPSAATNSSQPQVR